MFPLRSLVVIFKTRMSEILVLAMTAFFPNTPGGLCLSFICARPGGHGDWQTPRRFPSGKYLLRLFPAQGPLHHQRTIYSTKRWLSELEDHLENRGWPTGTEDAFKSSVACVMNDDPPHDQPAR
ncbi:uncharacterized protein LOC106012987 [Aplysia californica]|uniref:Uncharacterized protein LOC106012987 n=1 Tax=Aplysia californica TaxID=6500 RepID=A0ABM1A8P2_APLCA|nr:uncharacterized protein LOC106012987 [Aplysia californica]